MKKMLSLDLMVIGRYLKQEFVIAFAMGVVLSFAVGNVNVMPAAVAAMIPIALVLSAAALDEQGGWERFRIALPLSKRDVVCGRYACGALLAAAGIACGAVVAAVVTAAVAMAPGALPNAVDIAKTFELATVVCCLFASAACVLLLLSVMLPMAFKMGMSAGLRFMPVVAVVVVVIAVVLMNSGDGFGVNLAPLFDAVFATPASAVLASFVAFAAALAVYAASCALSCRLYSTREL